MKSISFLIILSLALAILGQAPTVAIRATPYQNPAPPTAEMPQKEAREELARRYAMSFTDPIFDERDIQRDLSIREHKEPPLSQEALERGVGGTVGALIVIHKDGKVNGAIATNSAGYGLDEAAIDAVKQWRFDPPTKDGQPVAAFLQVTINFNLGR